LGCEPEFEFEVTPLPHNTCPVKPFSFNTAESVSDSSILSARTVIADALEILSTFFVKLPATNTLSR
jgi:hypothetical protein